MASWLFLRAQDDRAGQMNRGSTEMEILVLQKWQGSGKRAEVK